VKVLLVDLETEWRGGQNQALLLLKGLRDRGHEAELVAANGSALAERAAASGVPVHSVSRGIFRLPAAWKVRELLRRGRFDVVHANEAHAVTAVWLGLWERRKPLRVPFVISRRVGYPIGKSPLAQARYKAAARVIAISRWSAERAIRSGVPEEKVTIVYEGVGIPAIPPLVRRAVARSRWGITEDTFLLGCVGVLSPDKGQECLIHALAAVRRKHARVRLLLAGDGPCRARLEALARELGLDDAVIFAGFVADIEEVYAALDLFLLPSFFEALSNALMSAMAYALPSIAFNCGGPAEIIEHGKSGLLIEAGNVDALSASIATMLDDSGLAKMIGNQGRERIQENFSVEKMVDGMIRVYEACVDHGLARR
jgi:glycosyltransferase involved in cell wall biosynthesis